ncbi:MAG: YraN family protein [Deltaproteobacteria bacterium]|jgi:putative endonuclease|nr:YraN family protein [Deltaproteobacteria bacterium]MBW2497120.1 YraN family protein [Deltaproteobacteria bacterium]
MTGRRKTTREQSNRDGDLPPGATPRERGHATLGREGEARAARFLETQGYRIVERNVRADRVEIDLVARRGPLLVFVEVKTRRSQRQGPPASSVDERKQNRVRHGAAAWLASKPATARGIRRIRFDVISCLVDEAVHQTAQPSQRATPTSPATTSDRGASGEGWRIEHWEGAF